MINLVKDWDLELQVFQFVYVYINGIYWGIYNICEKVNCYFIESYVDEVYCDSIDLLEYYLVCKRGFWWYYQEMFDFFE